MAVILRIRKRHLGSASAYTWSVQYHPENSFAENVTRRIDALLHEGFFAGSSAGLAIVADLQDRDAVSSAWGAASEVRLDDGLDAEVLGSGRRRREFVNFVETWIGPEKSTRGRA